MSLNTLVRSGVLLLGCVASAAQGQTYTVKADGTGDFDDLQAALDGVPAKSTILLDDSGSQYGWQSAVIRKAVTIIGTDSGALIGVGVDDLNLPSQVFTPVTIDAGDDDAIVLVNLRVSSAEGFLWDSYDSETPSIEIINAGEVLVETCEVTGDLDNAQYWGNCGPAHEPYSPHHGITVSGRCQVLAISNSTIRGAGGVGSYGLGDDMVVYYDTVAAQGGHGIVAKNAETLLVLNSVVEGGPGGNVTWNVQDVDGPPTTLRAGDGGDAIVGDAFISGSTLTPGRGGGFEYENYDWGIGQNGADGVAIAGARIDLPSRMTVTSPQLGATCTLTATGCKPNSIAFLLIGEPSGPLRSKKLGWWFIGTPWLMLPVATDGVGVMTLQADIPDDDSLLGLSLCVQVTDGGPLTEPEVLVFWR